MHSLPDAVVHDDQRSKGISPPPAEEPIEHETNQHRPSKVGINEGDMPLRHENGIAELLARHSFSKSEEEHGNAGDGEPCNATNRRSGMRAGEKCERVLPKNVEGQGEKSGSNEAKRESFTVLIDSEQLPHHNHRGDDFAAGIYTKSSHRYRT